MKKNLKRSLAVLLSLLMALSVFSAAPFAIEASAGESTKLYFNVSDTGWNMGDKDKIGFYIYSDAEGAPIDWGSKKLLGTKDTSSTYNMWEFDPAAKGITLKDNVQYKIIFFHAVNGAPHEQTYELFFDTKCMGDFAKCNGTYYENPLDPSKKYLAAYWNSSNPNQYGPVMAITSVGNVVGTVLPKNTTKLDLFTAFLEDGLSQARSLVVEAGTKTEQKLIDDLGEALGLTKDEVAAAFTAAEVSTTWSIDASSLPAFPDTPVTPEMTLTADDTTYGAVDQNGFLVPQVIAGLPADATGTVTFTLTSGKHSYTDTANVASGEAAFCRKICAGDYNVTAVYSGDAKYAGATATESFTVYRVTPDMTVTPVLSETENKVTVYLTINEDCVGEVSVRVSLRGYPPIEFELSLSEDFVNGAYSFTIPGEHVKQFITQTSDEYYHVTMEFLDDEHQGIDENYAMHSVTADFVVAHIHEWKALTWDWSDPAQPVCSTTCKTCSKGCVSGVADCVPTHVDATAEADAYTRYDASFVLDGVTYTDSFTVTEEGSMLAFRKSAAKAELETYKDPALYRDAEKTELANAIEAGNAAIDAAENVTAVAEALAAAKAVIDRIKTDAEYAAEELAADQAAAKAVDDLIDAIGTVEYTPECKAAIDAARAGYNALTDRQRSFVEKYSTLEAAEAEYARLKAEAEKPTASEGPGVCEFCGEVHDVNTISGFFTDFLHDLLFVLKQLTVGFAIFMFS